MTPESSGPARSESNATQQLLRGLAAMLRADFGYPASEAPWPLRRSAFLLGELGAGDAERLVLLARKWETAAALPTSA